MLAMVVNDYAGSQDASGALESIASELALQVITPYIAYRYL